MSRLIWKILLSGCIFLLPCSCQHKRVDYYYTSIIEYVNNCPGPVELKFEGKAAQVPDMLRIESGESKSGLLFSYWRVILAPMALRRVSMSS